jgi:phosphomannomutase
MHKEDKVLRPCLTYTPRPLKFGTSGRRGEVAHLTQLEIYINALAEIEYLQTLPIGEGGIRSGEEFYFAYDLRPSSSQYVPEQLGNGEIAQAIQRAIEDAGMRPVNLGRIPTPALTYFGVSRGKGSIMVTGSHIPFDRNGYKTNTAKGELLKQHEAPIGKVVEQVRERIYDQPFSTSLFNEQGLFKSGHSELLPETDEARSAYIDRYASFFEGSSLKGKRYLFYQHSAVGRDLVVELLEKLGAEVMPAGRSETFVPIDTENIDAEQLAAIQTLTRHVVARYGDIDAVVSTDGDSDRPLLLGVEPGTAKVRFIPGDLLGMLVAEYLGADAVVVPISCNDGIDQSSLAPILRPKTQIGSPFVIAGMDQARLSGKKVVCGWEANGGFLTGSDIERSGKVLKALPTRDAVLPILCLLFRASQQGTSIPKLLDALPRRFGRAALLKQFPRATGLRIVREFSPSDPLVRDVRFEEEGVVLLDESGAALQNSGGLAAELTNIRSRLTEAFSPEMGFGKIARLNYTDGVRIIFDNGDVAHLRPSGNADEFRIYSVADTLERAERITALGIQEPGGILRKIERLCAVESA